MKLATFRAIEDPSKWTLVRSLPNFDALTPAQCDYYAANAEAWISNVHDKLPGKDNTAERERHIKPYRKILYRIFDRRIQFLAKKAKKAKDERIQQQLVRLRALGLRC